MALTSAVLYRCVSCLSLSLSFSPRGKYTTDNQKETRGKPKKEERGNFCRLTYSLWPANRNITEMEEKKSTRSKIFHQSELDASQAENYDSRLRWPRVGLTRLPPPIAVKCWILHRELPRVLSLSFACSCQLDDIATLAMITSVIRPQRNSIWVAATADVLSGYLITKKDTAVYSFEESNQLREQKENLSETQAAPAFIFTCMEFCFVALPKGRAGVTLLLQHYALRLERLQRNIQTKYKHHLPLWYFLSNYLELLYHYSEACVQQHVAGKEWEEKNERERKRKGATLHTHTACPIYIYTIQKQIWQLHNGPLACFVRLFLSL